MPTPGIELVSVADALAALDHATSMVCAGEIAQVVAIATLCDEYRVDESTLVEGCERWVRGGAQGTPYIGEFLAADIGAALGVSSASGMTRIAQVVNVRHRHPGLWSSVITGGMRFYEAARVADACAAAGLSAEACWWVDRQCAIALRIQPWARVRGKIDGWILMADPALAAERAARAAEARHVGVGRVVDGHCDLWGRVDAADGIVFDQALNAIAATLTDACPDALSGGDASLDGDPVRAQMSRDQRRAAAVGVLARAALGQPELPRTAEIIVRIDAATDLPAADAMADAEPPAVVCGDMLTEASFAGLVLAPAAEVQGWGAVLTSRLGRLLDGCRVTVRPVIDARQIPAARGYEIPDAIRLAVTERWPVDAFPYGTTRSTGCDLDHSLPYGDGGKTHVDNLAPLKRFAHRVRTHGGWKLERTEPGRLIWTSPHGYTYAVTPAGTFRIGRPPPREHEWWNQEPPDWLAP